MRLYDRIHPLFFGLVFHLWHLHWAFYCNTSYDRWCHKKRTSQEDEVKFERFLTVVKLRLQPLSIIDWRFYSCVCVCVHKVDDWSRKAGCGKYTYSQRVHKRCWLRLSLATAVKYLIWSLIFNHFFEKGFIKMIGTLFQPSFRFGTTSKHDVWKWSFSRLLRSLLR